MTLDEWEKSWICDDACAEEHERRKLKIERLRVGESIQKLSNRRCVRLPNAGGHGYLLQWEIKSEDGFWVPDRVDIFDWVKEKGD